MAHRLQGEHLPQGVLIFRTGQLGDTLVSLPAIHAIRMRHPDSVLVLLTDRHPGRNFVSSWDVLCDTGWVEEVEFYAPSPGVAGKLANLWALMRNLRRRSLGHAYLLTPPRKAWQRWRDLMFFRRLAGVRHCHFSGVVESALRTEDGRLARMVSECQRLLAAVPGGAPPGFRLPVPAAALAEAEVALAGFSASDARLVCIAPGSKMPSKIWPVERYLELGRRLLVAHGDLRFVVLGGSEDAAAGEALCAAWGARAINLAGRVSVMGAAAVLGRCVAYVGNDTGTMHLAAMAGVRCVALFSARDNPGTWEPYGEGHSVLRHETDCAGCMLEVCSARANECLRLITVDEVLAATLATLDPAGNAN